MGVLSAVEHIFNEIAVQARTLASNRQAKTIKASHGPRVSPQSQAMERVKKTMDNFEGKSQGTEGAIQVSKAQATVKHRIRVSQVLKI